MATAALAPSGTGRVATGRFTAPALWLGAATVAALALALRLPIATTVLGLAAFGVLHNGLELRYVIGRCGDVLRGPFLGLMLALIPGVVVCRLAPTAVGRPAEIGLAYAVLGAAAVWVGRGRHRLLVAATVALALAAAASLSFPAYHFVIFTHLHNVVPLFFLWQWSAGRDSHGRGFNGRTGFRVANLIWVIGLPALILAGAFDRWLVASPTALAGFGGFGGLGRGGGGGYGVARLAGPLTPPAWLDTTMAVRFLALFAFMQTMHYVVWVGVLPRYAPDATARFESRVPALPGRRVWLLGLAGAAAFATLFAVDYATGKTIYAALASYHAYLEFPVLLALILGFKGDHR